MSRAHVVSSAEFSTLRDLELFARTTAEGLRQGLHRSPFHGFNAEFSQYRDYRPGDDLRYVDWKAFARSDRLFSRQFRETTNLAALFVLDVSRSMAFPQDATGLTGEPLGTKVSLARAAAAVLGTLVIDQGDAAGLLTSATGAGTRGRFVPARSGRHHLQVLLAALRRAEADSLEGVAGALSRAPALLRRRGMVIVLSDLYEDDAALAGIRRLARMGHDVIVVHVIAREEMTLSFDGRVEFEDLESGARLVAAPAGIRSQYEERFQQFLSKTESSIRREGLDYLRLTTGTALEPALRRFLVGRRRRA
jgi:uncharacterized protein (DUF58 family)